MTAKAQTTNNNFTQHTPEPVITYNHMETDGAVNIKTAGPIPVWSFLIEEFTIIGLLVALYFSI